MNSRRAWLVWGAAVVAYVVAVLQRSSLGVSGVEAQHIFGISASTLSTLAVVQLIVYAGLQIPVGVLLDLPVSLPEDLGQRARRRGWHPPPAGAPRAHWCR